MKENPSPSPNFSPRPKGFLITTIVLHDTVGTISSALSWFSQKQSKVSSHVVISKAGIVFRCVPDEFKAWHAGESALNGDPNVNLYSLGVELERWKDDPDPYPEEQLAAVAQWCAEKCKEYDIPIERIVGHDAIALPMGRKIDPFLFPWKQFQDAVAQLLESKEIT